MPSGSDHLAAAADRTAFAAILDAQGRHREALAPLLEALTAVEVELGRNHYDVALLLTTMGGVAERAGDFDLAMSHYERALRIKRRILGADHADVHGTWTHLAALRRASKPE